MSRERPAVKLSHLRRSDVGRVLALWVVGALGLAVSAGLLSGLHADSAWSVLVASFFMGVLGLLLRPLLVAGSLVLGWVGVLVATFLAQAIVVDIAVWLTPGMSIDDLLTALLAGFITSVVMTLASWLGTAGTEEAFLTSLVRRQDRGLRERGEQAASDGLAGIVFVQLDGVPYEVTRWGVNSGTLPTLARWVRNGSHDLVRWHVQIPCTTPVSQAGILHGTVAGLPAFRWYDRKLGRLVVASKPADMAMLEDKLSDGRGLLADGGVSVGNLFSGDAPTALATMSKIGSGRDVGPAQRFAHYLTQPNGLVRSIARSVAEAGRERFEARRQVHRDVLPRMHRSRSFALTRAATNGLMRDMNTALVAEAMLSGARSVYVDLVDYDEVAHHAGPLRPEALRTLETLDGVLGALEKVAEVAARPYHFVVLSDHGQSQGATFLQRYDKTLADLVQELTGERPTEALDADVEGWGRVDLLRTTVASSGGMAGKVADAGESTTAEHVDQPADAGDAWVVVGSGNLGLIYATGSDPLTLEEMEQRWPRLVPGLALHPGVSFVVARSAEGPVVIGAGGRHLLESGTVVGEDPLAPFPGVAADLLRAASGADAPDLYVNSLLDPVTEEVCAFEELVGCHGGAGGWQTSATLLAPADWPRPEVIHGADNLHQVLVSWLEGLGHRTDLPAAPLQVVDLTNGADATSATRPPAEQR